MNTAQAALDDAAERVVGERVAAYLDNLECPQYRTRLFAGRDAAVAPELVTRAGGLSEVAERGQDVPTKAREQILRRLIDLPGATLGVSGPRGVGKSTLLASNPEINGKRALAVSTAAPARSARSWRDKNSAPLGQNL